MSTLNESFTDPFTESFTPRSLGEWKGMEGNGREARGETSIHIVTSVTREATSPSLAESATAWMGRDR